MKCKHCPKQIYERDGKYFHFDLFRECGYGKMTMAEPEVVIEHDHGDEQ